MMSNKLVLLSLVLLALGTTTAVSSAQDFSVGSLETPSIPLDGSLGAYTVINDAHSATRDGLVNALTFFWSSAPCPAALKIKQFRHISAPAPGFAFIDEQGPFGVTGRTTTVTLSSPLRFRTGDVLGVTVLTGCGGPLVHAPSLGSIYVLAGDITTSVFPLTTPPPQAQSLDIVGLEQLNVLSLLSGRFTLSLSLTDPRTGRRTTGVATKLSERSAYFSAPGFTGDDLLPEVVVKITDATAAPPPFGGSVWVFHGSLTDTTYTLEVTDTLTGTMKQYVSSQPFCGGADTSAFRP